MSSEAPVREGQVLTGPLFNESMQVVTVNPSGADAWVVGLVGQQSELFRRVTLGPDEVSCLTIADTALSYDGDGRLLRLGLQAYALGIAHEFDPYFGLSISRVDPLPHQLEAVFLQLLDRDVYADVRSIRGAMEGGPCQWKRNINISNSFRA